MLIYSSLNTILLIVVLFTINSNLPLFMAIAFLLYCIIIRLIIYSYVSTWCFFVVFTVYIGGVLINVVYVSRLSGVVKYFLNISPLMLFLVFLQSVIMRGVSNYIHNRSTFLLDIRTFLVFFSLVLIRRIFLIVKMSESVLGSLTGFK